MPVSRTSTVFMAVLMASLLLTMALPLRAQQKAKKKAPEPPPPVPTRKIHLDKVNPEEQPRVLASAKMIDKLMAANYAKYKITPNPRATDEEFVRRVYLDVTGSIPTGRQARAFLTNRSPEKRQRLIDHLLGQQEAAGHLYNYWADILRLRDREVTNNAPGRLYNEWVKSCMETNLPYDKWVYQLITAEGKYLENPATGYMLRDSGMPLDSMNNTVRIFLGTQIGCAQCHDHPFDKWKRKEFYEVAAYTFGTGYRKPANDKSFGTPNVVTRFRDELQKLDAEFDGGGKYNRFILGNLVEVSDINRKLSLPDDYQYTDAKPRTPVVPRTIFDPQPKVSPGDTPRMVFAKWLTSPENPRFAKTIANRMWKRLFGVGQIEPVDDMNDETVAENPELMNYLTQEMIRLKFDVKEYLRILLNTQAYQNQATLVEVSSSDEYHFPGPILRRMTAEQVWDSFITLAVFSPDEYQMEPSVVQSQWLNVDLAKIKPEEIMLRDKGLREVTNYKHRNARDKNYTYQGKLLARASELPCPMPPDHFLRQFGQSDREAIQASSVDGSVPQVLQMFNGPITHMILHPKSLMYTNVAAEKTPDDSLNVIFTSILSRYPTDEERQIAMQEIKTNGPAGVGNVIWSLVNTREFLFIQ